MLRAYVSWSLLLTLALSVTACSDDGGGRASDEEDAGGGGPDDASESDAADGRAAVDAGADASAAMDGGGSMDSAQPVSMDGGADGSSEAGCTGPSCDGCKVALHLVADLSGSMNGVVIMGSAQIGDAGARDAGSVGDAGDAAVPPPSNQRIEALRNALHAFVDDPSAANTQLGLAHFPHAGPDAGSCAPGTECGFGGTCCPGGGLCFSTFCLPVGNASPSCDVADYAKPDVELGDLALSSKALHTAISALRAEGQSPEIVALEGALSYARGKGGAARSRVAVVLFADGPWNTCGPGPDGGLDGGLVFSGSVEPLAQVATRYAMATPAVSTYVIAIRGDTDAGQAYFDPVAAAGGTQQAYKASSADELLGALKAIREHAAAACK